MKINHKRNFMIALRTAILFVSSFIIYDFLHILQEKWSLFYDPKYKSIDFIVKEMIKFIIIFIIDLIILYMYSLVFHIPL